MDPWRTTLLPNHSRGLMLIQTRRMTKVLWLHRYTTYTVRASRRGSDKLKHTVNLFKNVILTGGHTG